MWFEWWQLSDSESYHDRRSKEVHVLADSVDEAKILLKCHIDVDSDNSRDPGAIIWNDNPDIFDECPSLLVQNDYGKDGKITVIFSETDWLFIRMKE